MTADSSLKKYTLVAVTMSAFITPFMGSAINLAIPNIGRQFNSGALELSWVATSYLLATAAFLVPFGRLADIVGRKKIFTVGITFFSLASLLCGMAWSMGALIAFRALQGIGGAMIFGTGMAILTSVFPPQERGKVLGINAASVYAGLSLGPVLGGAMNQHLGWQSIFYLTLLLGAAVVFTTVWKLKGEWAGAQGERFDWRGALLYTSGLVSLIYGFSALATSTAAKFILAIGMGLVAVFIIYEAREEHPILNTRLFSHNPTFAFSNLAALINYSATFAVGFLLSLHLQVVVGYDSQTTGLILLSQPVIMTLLSPLAGSLSDRIQPRLVASWGMGLTALGLLVFSFLNTETSTGLIMANLMLMGVGFALFASPNTNAALGSVEKRFYGVASSTLGTMRLTGQACSMALVTMIISFFFGNVRLSPEYAELLVKSTRTSFGLFALLCIGGIFASLARGNVGSEAKGSDGLNRENKTRPNL